MDTEKIKQKILDLAIRGKLIPQDPNSETAQDLIKKIQEEKAKLVKEGKIKPTKEESYIFKGSDNSYYEKVNQMTKNIDEEIPFEIPNNWCWGRLNQIGSIVGGGTPSTSVKKYWDNGNIVWITPAYMSKNKNRYINDSDRKITQLGLDNSSTKLMPPNSIIMSSRAPIGYLAINLVPACTSQGCKSIVPFITAMSEYLYYAIKSSIVRIIGASSGTTFDEISGTDFGNILIPIPPISEQQKICELLSKVFGEVEEISQNYKSITKYIRVAKNKILENIFGENSSYKSYYAKQYTLDDVLPYEQPSLYIVKSTNYSDSYDTPVLTPGKSFILGYTDETEGIYNVGNSKVIIFDDFTTVSRLIDFNFKVKSSAMKILKSSNESMFNIDYLFYLLQTLKVNNDTHKRYWISEYSQIKVNIHKYNDQLKIVKDIKKAYNLLDQMIESNK